MEFPDDIFTYESFEIKDVLKPELEPVTVEGDPTTVDAVFYLKENGDNSSYTAVEDQEARDLFAPFVYQAATNTVSTKVTKQFYENTFLEGHTLMIVFGARVKDGTDLSEYYSNVEKHFEIRIRRN